MPGRFVGQRRAPHARHTGDAAGALAAGNGRAGPPLCGRWPIRGLLGLLGRHAAHIASSPPACGGGHRLVLQRRHRPTCPTGPQHRGTRRSRVPLAMPALHYPAVGNSRWWWSPRPPPGPVRPRVRRPFCAVRHLAPSLSHKRAPVGREPSSPCHPPLVKGGGPCPLQCCRCQRPPPHCFCLHDVVDVH